MRFGGDESISLDDRVLGVLYIAQDQLLFRKSLSLTSHDLEVFL